MNDPIHIYPEERLPEVTTVDNVVDAALEAAGELVSQAFDCANGAEGPHTFASGTRQIDRHVVTSEGRVSLNVLIEVKATPVRILEYPEPPERPKNPVDKLLDSVMEQVDPDQLASMVAAGMAQFGPGATDDIPFGADTDAPGERIPDDVG